MKKGFALLETIIVITFVTVSLLLLYGTFTSMLLNREKNIEYDDAANIYKMYYLKEYLLLNGMNDYLNISDIREISCDDFLVTSCHTLWDKFHLEHVYLVPYRIHDYNENNYASSFNNYLDALSNNEDYDYRLVGEFFYEDEYSYASIGVISNE